MTNEMPGLSFREMYAMRERFPFEDEYSTEVLVGMHADVSAALEGMPESFHIRPIGEKLLHFLNVELHFRNVDYGSLNALLDDPEAFMGLDNVIVES